MAPEKEVDSTVSSDKAEATTPVEPNGKADQAVDTDSLQEENVSGDAVEAQEGEQLNDQASAEASNEATDDNVVSIDGEIIQEKSEASAEELLAELAAAEARASENWDKFVRLQAEMENQRKRAQKEVASARKFALEGMVEALLPIRDSLELGLNAADSEDADVASIREGSELTLKMLAQAFEKFNIEELNPLDEKFNPEFHQAMSMQAVEGKAPNTVTGVLQKGYTLNERLIRPALVMVSK